MKCAIFKNEMTNKGDVAYSMGCAEEYGNQFPNHGKGLQRWSKITDYYQNTTGWNKGKFQELKDRERY